MRWWWAMRSGEEGWVRTDWRDRRKELRPGSNRKTKSFQLHDTSFSETGKECKIFKSSLVTAKKKQQYPYKRVSPILFHSAVSQCRDKKLTTANYSTNLNSRCLWSRCKFKHPLLVCSGSQWETGEFTIFSDYFSKHMSLKIYNQNSL